MIEQSLLSKFTTFRIGQKIEKMMLNGYAEDSIDIINILDTRCSNKSKEEAT